MRVDVAPVLRTLWRQPAVLALMVLEIGAGVAAIGSLLISGAWYGRIGDQPSGLDEENLILISLYSPRPTTPLPLPEQRELDRERARSIAGVEGVTLLSSTIVEDRWSYPSLFFGRYRGGAAIPGSTDTAPHEGVGWMIHADQAVAATLKLRFASGAAPPPSGQAARPTAAILTRCLAERLFGRDGARTATGGRLSSEMLRDVPIAGVVEAVVMRPAFMPHAHCMAFVVGGQPEDREYRLMVRATPGRRVAVLQQLRAQFSPGAADRFVDIRPFTSTDGISHRVGHGLIRHLEFFGVLVGAVAVLGALAATSFLVVQRKRQIGVRRALGATKGDIVGYFLVESTLALAMGSLVGIAGTVGLYLLMRQVFASIHFDAGLLAFTLVVMWSASILATLIPALRAARVPPSVASRSL